MKYITKNIKQFYILKWHNLGYTKEKCPSASEKKLKIRLLKEKKLLRGKLKKKKRKKTHTNDLSSNKLNVNKNKSILKHDHSMETEKDKNLRWMHRW